MKPVNKVCPKPIRFEQTVPFNNQSNRHTAIQQHRTSFYARDRDQKYVLHFTNFHIKRPRMTII
jgi:hypothetical protein